MEKRTDEIIISEIKEVLAEYIEPAVAEHGGAVNFVSYKEGNLVLEMSGACSGCAGSAMTLQYGIERLMKEQIPEIVEISAHEDPFSTVDPFYTHPFDEYN
jgi:NFU1 iron-sulfur cluster scaffold homolog, mitochondrial